MATSRNMQPRQVSDTTREIPPDTNGFIIHSNGVAVGELEVNAGNELTFHWYQTRSAWPSEFDLIDTTSTLSIMQSDKFTHTTFKASAVSFNRANCQWRIEQKGNTIGYLYKTSAKLVWFATNLAPSALYFEKGELYFKANTDTGMATARDATDFSL